MNHVCVTDRTGKAPTISSHIKRVLRRALQELHIRHAEVSVVFVTDARMRQLNRRYRRRNRSTDVLSFSQDEKPRSKPWILGDIVIATPTARRQAKEHGHSVNREFAWLALHGLLHLLGYDHERSRDAEKMFKLQNRLLRKVIHAR